SILYSDIPFVKMRNPEDYLLAKVSKGQTYKVKKDISPPNEVNYISVFGKVRVGAYVPGKFESNERYREKFMSKLQK
ncbi:hypothetical protein, partial [Moorena sp. SIO4G3]|uniref:hypothetical protein n=1 Tax=Moorena sp. SIO4G3 TaxID=2607821 RepID=UPI0025F40100